MANNKLKIQVFAVLALSLFVLTACSDKTTVTKSSKPYYCIKSNNYDLKIRFGTKINLREDNHKGQDIYYGIQIDAYGKIEKFDDRYLEKKSLLPKEIYLNEEDFCKIYHWSKRIALEAPVLNEVGDTLKYFEFVSEKSSIFQRNTWHDRFKTKGSFITRNYIDSINIILRKYLTNMND